MTGRLLSLACLVGCQYAPVTEEDGEVDSGRLSPSP